MAPRTTATFAKRQKECTRQEKQQAKQQSELQRGQERRETPPGSESDEFGSNTEIASQSELLFDSTKATAEAAPTEGAIPMKKLHVGNLSFDSTEKELRHLFEHHDAVESVKLAADAQRRPRLRRY
ncbi:MAG TPA: RNA-binding protein [Terriglobales bacterium]|nr:RNA-binding protein [Terriglobales bacterium]